jgi:hypothetical protein
MKSFDRRLCRLESQQRSQSPSAPLTVWLANDEDPASALARLGVAPLDIGERPRLFVQYATHHLLITEKTLSNALT